MRLHFVACAAFLVAVILGCTSSPRNDRHAIPTADPLAADAMEAAIAIADHIIQDSIIQESAAQLTTYGRAVSPLPGSPPFGPALPASDTPVWQVTLKGLFYEPLGPASDPSSPEDHRPQERACRDILVLIDVSTGNPIMLTLRDASSCS